MAQVTPTVEQFRVRFPAFDDPVAYPDDLIEAYFGQAQCYIENDGNACLSDSCLLEAIYLMTAHLLTLRDAMTSGDGADFVTSATIDKVSVTVQAPPERDQWSWWLNKTPYGQQLLSLLSLSAVGGMYIGGLPEGSAFRKVGGIF